MYTFIATERPVPAPTPAITAKGIVNGQGEIGVGVDISERGDGR